MTSRGRKLFAKVEPLYARQVKKIVAPLKEGEQKRLAAMLGKVRGELSER
jgi:hypothetical protein